MKQGEIAEIIDNCHGNEGRFIMRAYSSAGYSGDQFVALDNPKSTWTSPVFQVRILAPGDEIIIHIGRVNDT